MSYRNSHNKPGKSKSYNTSFEQLKYRKLIWKLEKKCLNRILNKHLSNNEIKHLDFACGTGRILGHLEKKTEYSKGIDISHYMIEEAKQNVNSEIIEGDITKCDLLNNERFNLITAFRFFTNAENSLRNEAMGSLVKHLDKDGIIIFNNHRNSNSILAKFRFKVFKNKYAGMNFKEIDKLLNKNGLKIIDIYSIGLLPDSYNNKYLPTFILYIVEILMLHVFCMKNYGYNQIIVCRISD